MPPRVVRSEINASRSLARVSPLADLTFRALIVAVDDYGRCEADPLMLKADLFPRRPQFTPEKIEGWVAELVQEGCVQRYQVDGIEYLQLTGWEKHRSNSKRASTSRFPDPPEVSRAIPNSPGDPGNPRGSARLTSDVCRVTGDVWRECEESPAAAGAPPLDVLDADPPRAKTKPREERTEPPEAIEFADAFSAAVQGVHPAARPPTPTARREWIRETRLMLERDQRPLAELRAVADWLFNSADSNAQFWRRNVLSVPKFREKYVKLDAARRSERAGPIRQHKPGPLEQAARNILARAGVR